MFSFPPFVKTADRGRPVVFVVSVYFLPGLQSASRVLSDRAIITITWTFVTYMFDTAAGRLLFAWTLGFSGHASTSEDGRSAVHHDVLNRRIGGALSLALKGIAPYPIVGASGRSSVWSWLRVALATTGSPSGCAAGRGALNKSSDETRSPSSGDSALGLWRGVAPPAHLGSWSERFFTTSASTTVPLRLSAKAG
jgi:hypothetical protein